MAAGREIFIGGDGVGEREGLVHDGFELRRSDRAVHGLEHGAAADIDAGDAQAFAQHQAAVEKWQQWMKDNPGYE